MELIGRYLSAEVALKTARDLRYPRIAYYALAMLRRYQRTAMAEVFVAVAAALAQPAFSIETVILMRSDLKLGVDEIIVDGQSIGRILHDRGTRTLESNSTRVRLEQIERPISADRPFPLRIVLRGRLGDDGTPVQQEYDLLAPVSPIEIEGLGIPFSGDGPGVNDEEHHRLKAWLESSGLEPDTRLFEELHRADTGRDLRVWYEIAGRRVEGTVTAGVARKPSTHFGSSFHVTESGWKIHHARSAFYHRKSLDLVDTLTDSQHGGDPVELRSYQCGCYDWAIGGDWVTLDDRYLYHAAVEWQHHRVGAGLFVGLRTRETFPWIDWVDRKKAGRLARRAAAYRITDARGELFAEIDITLDPDPPRVGLGPQSYSIRVSRPDATLALLAEIDIRSGEIEIRLVSDDGQWRSPLDRLDTLLAAMPTQVLRGDGIRDSYLGEVETLVDWVRLIDGPNADTLADVVSEIDALTAVRKVEGLLEPHGERFSAGESDYRPLPPRRRLDESNQHP